MRFTKIPLIATLMAVALSLLIVLPALAQSSGYDDTRGQLKGGANLTVDVRNGVADNADTPNVDEGLAHSYFNGSLYVSNSEKAHNVVRIQATTAIVVKEFAGADGVLANRLVDGSPADDNSTPSINEANFANDNFACDALATVRNNNTGRSIKVYMDAASIDGLTADPDRRPDRSHARHFRGHRLRRREADGTCLSPTRTGPSSQGTPDTSTPPNYTFNNVSETVAEVPGKIPAKHGDTLTVTVAGLTGSVNLTVDAKGPEFSEISPSDNAYISSNTVKFRFVVTDNDSGLAHDGELDYSRGDLDARAYDTDGDGSTTSEPRSEEDGAAAAIDLDLGGDKSAQGTNGWRQRGDRAASPTSWTWPSPAFCPRSTSGTWRPPTARATPSAPRSATRKPDFTLTVDVSSPEFKEAFTGISYDANKKTEIVDRSSILVTFEDANDLDAVKDVDHTKFLVEGAEVVGAIHLGDKADCGNTDKKDDAPIDIDGNCIQQVPEARVYLQLAEALAPDATPQVSMFGGAALDRAGNPSNQDEVDAVDRIAPELTVTLTTAVGDRPVVRNGGEVAIGITSDEELRGLPTVWFVHIVDGGSVAEKPKAALGADRRGERVRVDAADNSWSRTYGNGAIGGRTASTPSSSSPGTTPTTSARHRAGATSAATTSPARTASSTWRNWRLRACSWRSTPTSRSPSSSSRRKRARARRRRRATTRSSPSTSRARRTSTATTRPASTSATSATRTPPCRSRPSPSTART